MSQNSPILALPYLQPAQAQKHVTHNEALRILDAVTQLSVLDAPQAAPPSEPAEGARYVVAPGASGAWLGHENAISVYVDNTWQFFAPQTGWRADVTSTGETFRFDGSTWALHSDVANLTELGVNTSADSTNRLAVASEATLLSHIGGGHQVKINKNAAPDTASLLYQTGWSGRAEMGTTGSDDFAIKVSADGSTFHTGISLQAGSGAVHMPQGQCFFDDIGLAHNTAYSRDIPWSDPARIMMWIGLDAPGYAYLVSINGVLSGAANFTGLSISPGGSLNFLTGDLNGTTGPNAALNLAIDASGSTPRLYLENRLGTTHQITLATLGR